MQESNFKNTVVLKNIPSNIIDEAIIVLKQNKKAWEMNKTENMKKNNLEQKHKPMKKDYIVKEAEMIVSNYIKVIDNRKKEKEILKKEHIRYKRLKKYAYFSTVIMFIQLLVSLIK